MLEEYLEHNKIVSILNTSYCLHCYITIPSLPLLLQITLFTDSRGPTKWTQKD